VSGRWRRHNRGLDLVLPAALGVSTEIVYLATVAVVLATNFVVFRSGIFHAKSGAAGPEAADPTSPSTLDGRD